MLIMLLLIAMIGAGLVHLFRKYILRIEEPTIEELLPLLESQHWFQQLLHNPQTSPFIYHAQEHGLLKDVHYVQKLLSHEGTRDGFIQYVLANKVDSTPSNRFR